MASVRFCVAQSTTCLNSGISESMYIVHMQIVEQDGVKYIFVKLRVLAGRTSEMLLKIKILKICWINSKTEARTELKCVQ